MLWGGAVWVCGLAQTPEGGADPYAIVPVAGWQLVYVLLARETSLRARPRRSLCPRVFLSFYLYLVVRYTRPPPPPIFQTREFGGVYSIKYQPEATAHVHVHAHAHVYVGCAWSCKARTTRTTHTALRAHLVFARDDRSRPPRSASRELMIAAVSTARERCGLPAPRHPALHLKPFDQHAGVVNDDGSLEPRSTQRHDR